MTSNNNNNIQENRDICILAAIDSGEYDTESSLSELEELAKTAGAVTAAQVTQKRPTPDSATFLGEGKIREIAEAAKNLDANLLIFDDELSAGQIRNIEDQTGIRVIDRTALILDIFAARALTAEGRLQVELAQLRYRLPRLSGMGREKSLSRLGGGIGTRGPGESQLETDRRHIRRRIDKLQEELKELTRRRDLARSRRKKDGRIIVSVVGYTNAGKSTLFNLLTKANVIAQDKLFATLDVTARALFLPGESYEDRENGGKGKTVTLTDTVGLIRRLPHHLIQAFKSTLEEAANADLILFLCDISDPEYAEKTAAAEKILAEIGCAEIPCLKVFNKCDKLSAEELEELPQATDTAVYISAKTGAGIDELKAKIARLTP
jgi:GTP-binding protein HflX